MISLEAVLMKKLRPFHSEFMNDKPELVLNQE